MITGGDALSSVPLSSTADAPAPPAGISDDGSGDWFASAQRVASIIAAGAALSLSASVAIAGSFKHQDEIAPASAGPVGSVQAPGNKRATSATIFQRWFAQDELPQAPPIALDDAGWTPPNPAEPKFTLPAWDDQVITVKVDESYWWQPYTITQTAQPVQWIDVEYVPPPAPTLAAEDEWQAPVIVAAAVNTPAWVEPDFAPQAPQLADVSEPPALLPIVSAIRAEVFTHQDEIAPQADVVYGGAGSAANQRALIEPRFRYWYQTDELPTAAAAFTPNESDGPNLERSRDSSTFTVWAESDEIVPQASPLGVDEAYWWQAQTAIVPAKAPLWQVEDDRPTPAAFTPPEEDGPRLRPSQDSFVYTVWAEDEPIVPQPPATIGFDADYWLTFPRPPGPLVTSLMQYLPTDEEFPELTAPAQPLTEWRRFAMNRRGR